MNNLYKFLAFLCLVFVTYSINAQSRTATITSDGLIVLDQTVAELAREYVADITRFHFGNLIEAQGYFQKFIEKTAGRGISYVFDIANNKLYIIIDVNGQFIVPKSHASPVTVYNFNEVFRMIHQGLL